MAALPDIQDPTLLAADVAIEVVGNAEPPRPYLGMSEIGRSCLRQLWYGFRWCSSSTFDAATLKRFADGHHSEDVQAERLSMASGINLMAVDPRTDEQFEYIDHGGHFMGHADGMITGLVQSPKTEHVWEHKATDESKQKKITKLKQDKGEKQALAAWDAIYYAQAVLYMHYSGNKRHYLTCSSPGCRTTISVRTDANSTKAKELIDKARMIITADNPLDRISESPSWYECKWCQHQDICHGDDLPNISCRTCLHATPVIEGGWTCAKFGASVDEAAQRVSHHCPEHRYIPSLISFASAVDASKADGWIEYEAEKGKTFKNGNGGLSSNELKALGENGIFDPFVIETKKQLDAVGVEAA